MKIKVTIDGKEHEVERDALSLPENVQLLTPDNIPEGYYTEKALQDKISERVKRTKEDTKTALLNDNDFQRDILSNYGIQLNEEGKPKGLKTPEDVEQLKLQIAEQVKNDYEKKLQDKDTKLNSLLSKGKKSSIIEAASKIGIDGKYLEPLVEGGSPYLVREVEDQFEWNDEIGDYALKDKEGFAVDGNGYVTAEKFFEKNTDKFKNMLKDQRQRGSNFNGQGNPSETPQGNPREWKREQKLAYIAKNGQEGYKKLLQNAKKE